MSFAKLTNSCSFTGSIASKFELAVGNRSSSRSRCTHYYSGYYYHRPLRKEVRKKVFSIWQNLINSGLHRGGRNFIPLEKKDFSKIIWGDQLNQSPEKTAGNLNALEEVP